MEEHEVFVVKEHEHTTYKEQRVEYEATYEYCENTDEYISTEEMITANDIAIKNAYRALMGLLTSEEIYAIRRKYGISQTDLAALLSWGAKTITRYETHQIQDAAHDTILRKIDSDPEWFLSLLDEAKDRLSLAAYEKYRSTAVILFEDSQDKYLQKSIEARIARFSSNVNCCGGTKLNIPKVLDVIRFYANSTKVYNLYKVKMMKLLWYADALCFKRYQHSMTGLVYRAYPMGAVPVAYESILDLKGIAFEEQEFDNSTAIHFLPSDSNIYTSLSDTDIEILNAVIDVCGSDTKNQIVRRMHSERAYSETALGDIIQYQYAADLSID
ncbi:MAG: DUF4065 domain-containing protein [Oscillospiraceae bacterium]|nr:DUF4065 domain-containing protein [Oscillospiraceae bacterium]